MASGRTHARVAVGLQVPLTIGGIMAGDMYDWGFGVGMIVGGLMGILITPDIDHHARTIEEDRFYDLGKWPGVAWEWAWTGYSLAIPHRGISHIPVIGTLTRVVYLAFMLRVITWILSGMAGDVCTLTGECVGVAPVVVGAVAVIGMIGPTFWLGLLLGWMAQDFGHLLFDL